MAGAANLGDEKTEMDMPYTEAFKAQMVRRMIGPQRVTATALELEVGVPQSSLSRWLVQANTLAAMPPTDPSSSPKSPRAWSPREKLSFIAKAEGLSGPELGALLRSEGVHEAQLQQWRQAAEQGLAPEPQRRKTSPLESEQARRIKELERELLRKDRALAETAALLVLKKKVQEVWGDGGGSTPERG